VGCDIDPACGQLQFNGQVEVIVGDATSRATSQKVKAIAPNFGVIVDDGSHVSADIILSLARYLPSLSPGGAYVIEDLHASYWPSWGGWSTRAAFCHVLSKKTHGLAQFGALD
jgi:hypothetical protein